VEVKVIRKVEDDMEVFTTDFEDLQEGRDLDEKNKETAL